MYLIVIPSIWPALPQPVKCRMSGALHQFKTGHTGIYRGAIKSAGLFRCV